MHPNEQILNPNGRYRFYCHSFLSPRSDRVEAFQALLRKRMDVSYAVATLSGKMAFKMLLQALSLPAGSRVIFPAYGFSGLPQLAEALSLVPVYCDVDPVTGAILPEEIEKKRKPNVKAAVATHLFGLPADARRIAASLDENVWLIFDSAHTPVAPLEPADRKRVAAFLSFDRLKPVNTIRGGMILTRDESLGTEISRLNASLPEPSALQTIRMIVLHELEVLIRQPICYALAGRALARPTMMNLVRNWFRRINFRQTVAGRRYSDLQAEIGLQLAAGLESSLHKRLWKVETYLKMLESKSAGESARQYLGALRKAYCGSGAFPTSFVVAVRDPGEVQRLGYRLGFELLAGDRITHYCAPPSDTGFIRARHLLDHALKLPLSEEIPRDRFEKFADQLTDLIAKNLAPFVQDA